MSKYRKAMLAILLLLVLPSIFAENPAIYLRTNALDDDSPLALSHISTYNENIFYQERYESFFESHNYGVLVSLFDKNGELLREEDAWEEGAFFYSDGIVSIKLEREGRISHQQDITFCNDNNICEPCQEVNCNTAESYLTCSDCKSGSEDNYCDLEEDGVCDSDCDGLDPDCSDCQSKGNCLSASDRVKRTCADYDGVACEGALYCTGGEFVLTDDYFDECCVGGFCEGEDVEEETLQEKYSVPYEEDDDYSDEVRDSIDNDDYINEYIEKGLTEEEPEEIPLLDERNIETLNKLGPLFYYLVGFVMISVLVVIVLSFFRKPRVTVQDNIENEARILFQRGYQQPTIISYLIQRGYKQNDIVEVLRRFGK